MEIDNLNEKQKPNKSKKILNILLILLIVFLVLFTIIYALYKSLVDVSSKNEDKFDYVISQEYEKIDYDLFDFLSYDSTKSKDLINISIPKTYFYNEIVDINAIVDIYKNDYDITINKIGTLSNMFKDNSIDIYADITYKNMFNAFVSGIIEYQFTEDNGMRIVLKELNIGDGLPSFIYKGFLSSHNNELLYELNPEDYELLKKNILKLDLIKNIRLNKKEVLCDFDYMSNLKIVSEYIFGESSVKIDQSMESIMPIIVDMIINSDSNNCDGISELIPMIFNENEEPQA